MDERMGEMHEEMMGGDENEMGDDEEEDDEMGGEENAADADADGDDQRTVTLNGEEQAVDEALADLRAQYDRVTDGDVESQTRDRADEDEADADADGTAEPRGLADLS